MIVRFLGFEKLGGGMFSIGLLEGCDNNGLGGSESKGFGGSDIKGFGVSLSNQS